MGADRAGGSATAASPPAAPTHLGSLQAALYELITAPEGVASRLRERAAEGRPLDLDAIVRAGPRMGAAERVDVYANMYFYRILEVLRDEFAKVVVVVGDAAFHDLVTDYLLECRPAHPSLREVGARLPSYLSRHPLGVVTPFLAELARLERAHLELFDGADCPALSLDAVRRLAPEALPDLELRAIPCHAVLANDFEVSSTWTALEARGPAGALPPGPAARAETLLVWRQDLTVYHRRVDADEAPLLRRLGGGPSFAHVCEQLLETVDAEAAPARAFELLGRWITDGLIADPSAAGTSRP